MIDIKGPAHPLHEGHNVKTIIGLSGYARSGKDEVAKVLVEEYGFQRFAFADKLREMLYQLNPIVESYFWYPNPPNGLESKPEDGTGIFLQEVIDSAGWNGYKETRYGPEIRRLLQRLGTEAGREVLGDDIWVKELDKLDGRIVVTDMRFPNEYDRVVDNGGQAWRIHRPGITAVNAHISETAIDDKTFDYDIQNKGTLDDLEREVCRLADSLGW